MVYPVTTRMKMQKTDLILTTTADFEKDVLKSELPALVDFHADWCGPCHMIEPVIEQLAEEYRGKVRFAKLDVDANPEVAARYGVMGIPTLIVFKNGEEVSRIVGAAPKHQYVREIQAVT